jgi:carbon storage regulator
LEVRLLSFTRKTGQGIRIGDGIRITVKEIRGRQVRLIVEAPKEVAVYREEVYRQIAEENERAARMDRRALDQLK